MALQDILDAITKQTDDTIMQERTAHNKRMTERREQSEQTIARWKQEIATQKEDRKQQMLAKAQSRADMLVRSAELTKKQQLLDDLYAQVAKALAGMDESKLSDLIERCLKQVHGHGEVRPAKAHAKLVEKHLPSGVKMGDPIDAAGGFIFISTKEERDCTFEHLVASKLRPATEVTTAHSLFFAA